MAVLAVFRIEAAGDDQADARGELGEQRRLPGAVGAVALAGDHHLEAAPDDRPFGDRKEPPQASPR